MKVLHVIDSLHIGGAEKVFVDITMLLAGKGVDVSVLVFHKGGKFEELLDKRIRKYFLDSVNKYSFSTYAQIHKVCRNYDIVHVHLKSTFNYVAIARLLFNGKYKTILHDHSGDHDKFGSKVSLSARYILRPQYYIGVTEKLHQWAVSELGIPEKRTFTLVNTIIPNEKIVFNQKSGLNKAFLISNIRATKNIEFAIDLFNTLSWSLSIFGNNFADSAYYNKIMNYPRTDKIEIVEGVYDFSEIYDQYAFAVHTAKSESGPLVLLEYLAYGIPFLAYRTGEIAEKIHGELPEYFVDSFDVDRWVEKIEVVRSKTDTGEKFKWIFHKYFGPEKYANNCLDIYNAIDLDGR